MHTSRVFSVVWNGEDEKLRRKEERDDACYLVCTFDEMNENFTCYEKVTFLHRLEVFMLI